MGDGAAQLAHATPRRCIRSGCGAPNGVAAQRSPAAPQLVSAPLVTVRVGPQVALTYDDLDADTKRIMHAIVAVLPDEAKVRREPTPQELARTYPPGYRGERPRQAARRPGRDT